MLHSKTDRWPHHLTQVLQTLMVEKDLFTVHRLDHASKAKLREITQSLQPHFAFTTWDAETERLLQEKVQHKIKRVRAGLLREHKLVRRSNGYVVADDDDSSSHGLGGTRAAPSRGDGGDRRARDAVVGVLTLALPELRVAVHQLLKNYDVIEIVTKFVDEGVKAHAMRQDE